MNVFSHHDEERLLSCVKQAQRLIADGDHPDDAIVKVARLQQPHPDMLPLIVQACNVGRQAYQQEDCHDKRAGVGCLLQPFQLADLDNVRESLYPKDVKAAAASTRLAAVSDDYARPPVGVPRMRTFQEKAASVDLTQYSPVVPDRQTMLPETAARLRLSIKKAAERAIDDATVAVKMAEDELYAALAAVKQHFKQGSHWSLDAAAKASRRLFGAGVNELFAYVRTDPYVKAAEAAESRKPIVQPANVGEAPFSLIGEALRKAAALSEVRRELIETQTACAERLKKIAFPVAEPATESATPEVKSVLKRANMFSPVLAGVSGGLASGMRPKPTADLVRGTEAQLSSPEHIDELQAIQARAMLTDLLQNDEVISGYDPSEVMSAFNEIVQLSPSAATQSALMRPLLRQQLQSGGMAPFEAQQVAAIENTVRQSRAPVTPGAGVKTPNV